MIPAWRENQPHYNEVKFETMVREGWRRNELIFACISKTANTSRSLSLDITNRDGKVLEDHPAKRMLQSPNPFMNESDLWASVIIFLKLAGVAYYEKERSAAGRVVGLWPLRPDWVFPKITSKGITAYEYRVPGMQPVMMPPEDILRFSLFDPLGLFRHYPPVAVAARSADSDNAVTDYIKLFFDEGGTPPGIFSTDQMLTETDISRIRASWKERYGGWRNWREPIVLSQGTTYQKTGASAVGDAGWDMLDKRNESRICMVLDVPPIIIGTQVGLAHSTFSNYAETRQSWWEDSILPMFENFLDTIQNGLLPEFGGNIAAQWDDSRIPALQVKRDAAREQALNELRAGAITRNQFNERIGMEDLGSRGEVYLMPINYVEVPLSQMAGEAQGALPLGSRNILPAYSGNGHTHITVEPPPDNEHKRLPPDDKARREIEKRIEDDMNEYFAGLLREIQEGINAAP